MRRRTHTAVRALAVATVGLLVLAGCTGTASPIEDPVPPPVATDPPEPSVDPQELEEAWQLTATMRTVGDTFEHVCPPGGSLRHTVWGGGDGYYTDDSSICVAAVHAGLITVADGGTVRVEKLAGRDAYEAYTANGVTTQDYGQWGGTFLFPDAPGAPNTSDVDAAPVRTPDPDQRRPHPRTDTETFVA